MINKDIYLDVNAYNFLQGVSKNEGNGIPMGRLTEGSGLTALHQSNLVHNEDVTVRGYPTIPVSWGLSFLDSMKIPSHISGEDMLSYE